MERWRNMKKIKIHFLGFWEDFNPRNNMFTSILRRRYELEYDSVDPDFLICSPLCKPFEYMRYDCPRIMYTGEFISVDFTAIDYFIGYDDISFGDRAMRFPLFLFNDDAVFTNYEPMTEDEAVRILKEKKYFCNYIFGHDTELGIRERILEGLQAYKRVECAGTHRNNMPGGKTFKNEILRGVKSGRISEYDVRRCCENVVHAVMNSAIQREYIG